MCMLLPTDQACCLDLTENMQFVILQFTRVNHKTGFVISGERKMEKEKLTKYAQTYITPSEWLIVIRNARCLLKPYEAIRVYYPDILDWKSLSVPRKLQSVWTLKSTT
ncbi:hypothetical protein ILUMI_25450 [Ignelater luminosus]|uniref:Uncharacterized protein n=1 Tax=Ignelater luminosus TaxID=2038154 RepID=A0A8K0G019_IGNLU|nr:hypothetical protein ILUMI_25450 [Ignelater luminosus]